MLKVFFKTKPWFKTKARKAKPVKPNKKSADNGKDAEDWEVAEDWAVREFGMERARAGQSGFDGILPCGMKIQVKSKKWPPRQSDAQIYVDLSEKTVEGADAADLLVIAFVDKKN